MMDFVDTLNKLSDGLEEIFNHRVSEMLKSHDEKVNALDADYQQKRTTIDNNYALYRERLDEDYNRKVQNMNRGYNYCRDRLDDRYKLRTLNLKWLFRLE